MRRRRSIWDNAVTELHWLPSMPDWRQRLRILPNNPVTAWDEAVALANTRLNFVLTNGLDQTVRRVFAEGPAAVATKSVRLAVLGSSTLTHLLPAIWVGGLRRGIWVDTYETDFGQYRQELADRGSALHEFARPRSSWRWMPTTLPPVSIPPWMPAKPKQRSQRYGRGSRTRGAWHVTHSTVRSSIRPPCRCIFRCSAATNIACPARARGSSPD